MTKPVLSVLVSSLLIAGCTTPPAPVPESPGPGTSAVQSAPVEKVDAKKQIIAHVGIGAAVSVSSTQRQYPGEGAPEALVDGNLLTRWSSEYAQPQKIEVKLPKARKIAEIRLFWEAAAAKGYTVSVSADGKTWAEAASITKDDPGPREDKIALNGKAILAVRLDLLQRSKPKWGFSLYEIAFVKAK